MLNPGSIQALSISVSQESFGHQLQLFVEIWDRLRANKDVSVINFVPRNVRTHFSSLYAYDVSLQEFVTLDIDEWVLGQILLDSYKEVYGKEDDDFPSGELPTLLFLDISKLYTVFNLFLHRYIRKIVKKATATLDNLTYKDKVLRMTIIIPKQKQLKAQFSEDILFHAFQTRFF
jgi:hypothetical protein